jgi:ribosomal protein S1
LVKVHAISDFKLEVKFVDGLEGVVDLSHLVHSEDAGVFAVLKDEKVFQQVTLEYGAVSWPIGLDLAPDAMYDEIKETGVFSL